MSEKEKWLATMKVYDTYERRFAKARVDKTLREPWQEETRKEIVEETKKVLGYDEKLVPEIGAMEEISHQDFPTYRVTQLRYMTWKNFYVSASLYMPYASEPVPLVFLLCGHGAEGRLTKSYVYMAHRLAKLGMAVMVPDNIGQGDRECQGHWDCIGPFYCGLSLQGMIVMETVALIRHMKKDPRFDASRFASCGNSGGGTLNLFLAALAPEELSALSSSGYPSEFSYILAKERVHCSCNLLPGVAHGPEMWEIFSVFAPKPMLLEQGSNDSLIPYDYAQRNARKLKNVYIQMDAHDNFQFATTNTTHSWTSDDRYVISKFLAETLHTALPVQECDEEPELVRELDTWHVAMPEGTYTTDQVAERLTGMEMSDGTTLADVYPPVYEGNPVCREEIMANLGRGDVMRVLAQMECALCEK